jgi:hypothetical protein
MNDSTENSAFFLQNLTNIAPNDLGKVIISGLTLVVAAWCIKQVIKLLK